MRELLRWKEEQSDSDDSSEYDSDDSSQYDSDDSSDSSSESSYDDSEESPAPTPRAPTEKSNEDAATGKVVQGGVSFDDARSKDPHVRKATSLPEMIKHIKFLRAVGACVLCPDSAHRGWFARKKFG